MLQAIAARRITNWPPAGKSPRFVQSAQKTLPTYDQLYLRLTSGLVVAVDTLNGIEDTPVVSVLRQCRDDRAVTQRMQMMLRANGYLDVDIAAYSVAAFNPHVDVATFAGYQIIRLVIAMYCGNVEYLEQILNAPATAWLHESISPAQVMMNPTTWEWYVQTHDVEEAIMGAIKEGADPTRLSLAMPKPNDPARDGHYMPPSRYYSAAASAASSNEDLSTLRWLHATYGPGWTVAAIYAAAQPNGDHKALHYLLRNGCPHPASYDEFMARARIDADDAFEDPDMFDGMGTLQCAARMFAQALEITHT